MEIRYHQKEKIKSIQKSYFVNLFFVTILSFVTVFSFASETDIRVIKTTEGYQFYDADKPVLFYQVNLKTSEKGTHSRANYCHPVNDLNGNIVTEDFPRDHLHHRGIFWSWRQVIIGDTRIHDMWECKNFIWDVHNVEILENQKQSAAIRANVYWKSPQWNNGKSAFAEETVTIRVHEKKNKTRAIDFSIEIQALEQGLKIGGSDNSKEYGGFSPRIVLPKDITMNDSSGIVKSQRNALEGGDWLNFTGTFGKTKSGIALLVHPTNPGSIHKWVLRKSRSMQNAAYPGRKPIPIFTEKPLVLKYRLVFHYDAGLEKLYKEYCATVK